MEALGSLLLCGLSSGQIGILKLETNELEMVFAHDKPVRSL